MDREQVSSSLVASVGYDSVEEVLEVELQDGEVYQYRDVPVGTYHGLLSADRVDRYFNHHIRRRSSIRIE